MAYTDILNPNHPASFVTVSKGQIIPRDKRPVSTVPLEEKKDAFMEHVTGHYSAPTVANYRWCVNMIIRQGKRDFNTYNRLLKTYTQSHIRCYIIQTLLYDFYDLLPSSGRLNLKGTFYKLSLKNQELVEDLMRSEVAKGLAKSTVNLNVSYMSCFLAYVEDCGITDIHDITDRIIREYSAFIGTETIYIHRVGNSLKTYAELNSDHKLLEIVALFPSAIIRKKVYTPMLSNERERFEAYITDPASPLSKRKRAVATLMFYTGMRSSDAKELKLADICLGDNTINFVQKKTGSPVSLPMIPVVSNAIVDYVRNERVRDGSPLLFQPCGRGQKARKGNETRCDVCRIINQIYDAIGIRKDGARRGTHLLRHAAADKMLNTGTDVAVISRILGHKNPETTMKYINANIEQLRSCTLPLRDYPIKSPLYDKKDTQGMV